MKKLLIAIILILILPKEVSADSIYQLIKDGKLDEARAELSKQTSASVRDGDHLFYTAMVEPNASKSARLLEAALNAGVSATYRETIYYYLAQYYFMTENLQRLAELVIDYQKYWENGKYRPDILRMAAYIDEKQGKYESAIRKLDRFNLQYQNDYYYQLGTIDKARAMISFEKNVAANKLLRKISKEKSGSGVSIALYMLASHSIRTKQTDDAVFYYNLLREGYPSAIGLDATIDRMESLQTSGDRDNRAEKLTGTFYSIQVGAFSSLSNARKHSKDFDQYDLPIDIKDKEISSRRFHVVYIGRFSTYEDAASFKNKLEAIHNEVFQVVAR